jgi:hypothetical protein
MVLYDDRGRQRQVVAQPLDRLRDAAVERRLHDRAVLAVDVPRPGGVRQETVSLGLLVQDVPKAQEPCGSAAGDEGQVKAPMQRSPRLEGRARGSGHREGHRR